MNVLDLTVADFNKLSSPERHLMWCQLLREWNNLNAAPPILPQVHNFWTLQQAVLDKRMLRSIERFIDKSL